MRIISPEPSLGLKFRGLICALTMTFRGFKEYPFLNILLNCQKLRLDSDMMNH
jgi:hypothetical protein